MPEPEENNETLIEFSEADRKRIDQLLLEGLNSGDPIVLDEAEWQRIREEVAQRRAKPSSS